MLEFLALQHAVMVAEQGSFRRAAIALGVRTSVVSRRIRALEDEIGVSLFQRQSQGVQPTHAGHLFLTKADQILRDVDSLCRLAHARGAGAEGQLTIGLVASIAGGNIRELLMRYRRAYAGVTLDLVDGLPHDHIAAVRALKMDVALVVDTPAAIGCVVEPLWAEPIFVALPASSRLASANEVQWEDLASELFLVSSMGPGKDIEDIVIKHLADLGRRPVVEPRAVQRGGLLGLVSLGLGVSLVGSAEAAVSYPDVVFRRLRGEHLPFSAVWAENNDNPVLRRFLSLARLQTRSAPVFAASDRA